MIEKYTAEQASASGIPEIPNTEEDAELLYYDILDDPESYGFESRLLALLQNPNNKKRLVEQETYLGKITFIYDLLERREREAYRFELLNSMEKVKISDLDIGAIKRKIDSIRKNQKRIGSGLDAYVVIDESELPGLPPETCYKIAKEEETPRGRNTLKGEASVQLDFFKFASQREGSVVGVPAPYYTMDFPSEKIIAMEVLNAVSISQLSAGNGHLPDWIDIDRFVEDIREFLNEAHEKGLYHRDLHMGNILVRQDPHPPEDGKWGYVIDFGLSLSGANSLLPGDDPYITSLPGGGEFRHLVDDRAVTELSNALRRYREQAEMR